MDLGGAAMELQDDGSHLDGGLHYPSIGNTSA
jgi:hypothetical protein